MREEVGDDIKARRNISEEAEVILEAKRLQEQEPGRSFRQDAARVGKRGLVLGMHVFFPCVVPDTWAAGVAPSSDCLALVMLQSMP